MKEAAQAAIFIAVQYVIAFIICLIAGFSSVPNADILENLYNAYRFNSGLLSFIGLLPALQISGLLVGYSWAFGKYQKENPQRWSPTFLSYMQGAIIVILGCMVITITGFELGKPALILQRQRMETNSAEYRAYIALARENLEKNDFSAATFYSSQAKQLIPESEEAAALDKTIEIAAAEPYSAIKGRAAQTEPITSAADPVMTSSQLLETAEKYFSDGDYLSAHYYASLLSRAISDRDPDAKRAKELASEAWNKLNDDTSASVNTDTYTIYTEKRKGYLAIQEQRYVTAYYIFKRLANTQAADPDIKRFLQIAADNLKKTYFFTDETENLQQFESSNNVYFSVPYHDGSTDIIFIKGITLVQETGTAAKYLRNFNVAHFDAENKLLWHAHVPYAKMIPIQTDELDEENKKDRFIPLIMLQSVDRDREGLMTEPTFVYTDDRYKGGEQNIVESGAIMVMPIPFSDFPLIADASHGPESMSLFALWQFGSKAQTYGYSGEVFVQNLIERLCFPFLILILSMLATILGWNYRIPAGKHFRPLWLLPIPLFTIISWFVIKTAQYVFSLFICLFVGSSISLALPITVVSLVVVFVFSAVLFVSQRGE